MREGKDKQQAPACVHSISWSDMRGRRRNSGANSHDSAGEAQSTLSWLDGLNCPRCSRVGAFPSLARGCRKEVGAYRGEHPDAHACDIGTVV